MALRQNSSNTEAKERVFALQIVAAQVVFTLVLSLLGSYFSDQEFSKKTAIAILYGGAVCVLSNLWLAIVAFRPALGKTPAQMLTAFYIGEMGKFIITAMLFLIAFKTTTLFKQPLYALLIISAYVSVQCTTWVYPLARSKFIARWRR